MTSKKCECEERARKMFGAEARQIVEAVGAGKEMAIPILQEIQKRHGYLPLDLLKEVCRHAEFSEAELYGVATFYSQFRFKPRGKHPIKVCIGTACHVGGAAAVLDALCDELKTEVGGTTEDGNYSIETVACIGCCSLAPVMMVGDQAIGNLDPLHLKQALKKVSQ